MFLEYGVDSNKYVHISQVTSGRVPLMCPYCNQGLIARKGNIKEHHFAHDGETCRESNRDFEALNIPYFDKFHIHLDGKTWHDLQNFHAGKWSDKRLLEGKDLIYYNDYARIGNYELTHYGKIPFGEASLNQFQDHQITAIYSRHHDLSETIRLAKFGEKSYRGNYYIKHPAPDMVTPGLIDINIFRSQVARVFKLDLYLLKIITPDIENLFKVGVTSNIDRRVSEIQRDLSQHLTIKKIEVDRLLKRRGAVERYALHRYRDNNHPIGNLTEYFQFDKKTVSNVRRDFTTLGHFNLVKPSEIFLTDAFGEIREDNGIKRHSRNGLITSICNGEKSQIEIVIDGIKHREKISEGTRAGMQRAKDAGKHVGRPSEDRADTLEKYPNVIECLSNGMSLRRTASECGVSVNTVRKVKAIIQSV